MVVEGSYQRHIVHYVYYNITIQNKKFEYVGYNEPQVCIHWAIIRITGRFSEV